MSEKRHVVRHAPIVRLIHWLIAGSGLLLVFSGIGFMPLYGRFYLNELPGMAWVSDMQAQMDLHYFSAALFVAACLFHLVFHWRRREFALVPRKGDVRESGQIIKAMLTGREEPAHDKFLAEQRIAYAAFVMTVFVLVVSGYFLTIKNSLQLFVGPQLLQAVVLAHLVFTFIFFLQILLHLAAFLLKVNRPLLAAMFHGRVAREYATQRHPLWLDKKQHIE